MQQKVERPLFFKVPSDLKVFRKLLREPQGFRKALLYLMVHYLSSENNPLRLSANYIRKRFRPFQVNAVKSHRTVHPCLKDFLDSADFEYARVEEYANLQFPVEEGFNKVFYVPIHQPDDCFLFPHRFMNGDFGKIFSMAPLKRNGRSLNISIEKLYIFLWLWRLWQRKKSTAGEGIIYIDVALKDLRQEISRIRKRKNVKPREILSALECMDHLIRIIEIDGRRCVIELLA